MAVPIVSIISPAPNSTITPSTPLVVDVTDADGAGTFRRIIVSIRFVGYGIWEIVFDGEFAPAYAETSTSVSITNGFRFTLARKSGWPDAPQLYIYAIDQSGNEAA